MTRAQETARLADKYDVGNVPGYLSYPPVHRWHQPITEDVVRAVLDAEARRAEDAYVYAHFPYCEALCYYCACYMRVTSDPKGRYDAYLDAMEREFALKLGAGGRLSVGELHWGGGTPTYMDCAQIERAYRIVDAHARWRLQATRSVEAYPDARVLGDDKLRLLRDLGFDQISFGVESLDPKVLRAINRRHDLASVRHFTERARALGFGVHLDVVYGLPYQTEESLRATLRDILQLAPDRLASFAFMYTPLSVKHQRAIPVASVPGTRERLGLYRALGEELGAAGYQRVGVDHYVRGARDPLAVAAAQGRTVFHFQGYEPVERQHFFGFGSAAVSYLQHHYFQNVTDVRDYVAALSAGRLPLQTDRSAALDDDDRLRHRIIMKSLMADLAIDKDALEAEFGVSFDRRFAAELERLRGFEADGLVTDPSARRVAVTEEGRAFVRNIAQVFDAYATPPRRRVHLPTVPPREELAP
ncbi:MAG: oxygen-independent coproporphyrinogen III oxidase [Polyangiales bacterium]